MPHASKDELSVERMGDYQGRMTQFGDYNVAFESLPAGFPPNPEQIFKGLPDDACQCAHWGYVFKGKFKMTMVDGSEEVVEAGQAYYMPPGHRFQAIEECELVEFSPKGEFEKTIEHVSKNMETMQTAEPWV
jgi:hypothetical protein